MAAIKTSPLKTNRLRFSQSGLTLIEILIVLGILAAIVAVGVPRLTRKSDNIKKVAREFKVLSKEIRNASRISGDTYRLVIQFENTYQVEVGKGEVLAQTDADAEREKDKKFGATDEEKSKNTSGFSLADRFNKKPKTLPSGYYFAQVETQSRKDPIKEGSAPIYYSPQGLVEQSIIQITDKKNLTWSFAIHPLTGQVDIVEKEMSLRDLKQ